MFYIFADCTLDTRCYTLHRNGVRIPLGPKAFRALTHLLQHRDRVVSKDELCALLWPAQAISDTALTQCLASLRKALGDTGNTQQIIQTVYGQGYRFIAAVYEKPDGPSLSANHMGAPQGEPSHQAQRASAGEAASSCVVETSIRREVTVLCGTLVQPANLTARLNPSSLHSLVACFFEQAYDAVQHWGGTIHTFLDDSFVALFGAPTPCEEHVQWAIQVARQLQRKWVRPSTVHGITDEETVTVRFGAHTGFMLGRRLGSDRRWTYLALGDTLRRALQLSQLAEPDTLLLSEATALRVQEDVGIAVGRLIDLRLGMSHDTQPPLASPVRSLRS